MSATLSLIRQDPARGGLVRAVLSCVAGGGILRIAPDLGERIVRLGTDDLPGGFVPFYLLLTAMTATFILGANAWTRSSRLALGLPLPTRKVWIIRTGSLVTVALLSVTTLAVTLGISIDLETRHVSMNPVIALAAARAAATSLVLLFLYQLPQSKRDRIPISAPYVVYIIGASLLVLVFSSVSVTSVAGTLFIFAVALALGVYLYLRVPTTFSVGPTIEESESPIWSMPDERDFAPPDPIADDVLAGHRRNPQLALHWTIFRGLKTSILAWFLILIVGSSAAVVILEFFKGTNAYLPLFFLVLYHLPLLQTALENSSPYDPLPISRRVLWAHSAGPIVISAAIGAAVGLSIFALSPGSFSQVQYSKCCVKVPWDYLELSRDGQVPAVTAPWGESHTPTAHRLWKGRAAVIYDPFEVGQESSPRFIELQMRRAVEAVYGIPVPVELKEPIYKQASNIAGGVERGSFTFEMTRGRISGDRLRTAAAATLVLILLVTVMIVFALLQYGSSVHRKIFKRTSIGGLIFIVVLAVAVSVARLLGSTEVWYVGALISMGIRSLAHWLPFPTSILWLICVTFGAGAYLLLERIFCGIEFPREKTMNRFAEEY
jgi:hypothetical protein